MFGWRQVALVALTWVGATILVSLESWALHRVSMPASAGFWAILLSVVGGSFVMFFSRSWPGQALRELPLIRVLVAAGLAIATYVVAINTAFVVSTFVFGA
jgi:hypothetical protein